MTDKYRALEMTSCLATYDDGALIQMAIAGAADCFSELIDRHLKPVRRVLRSMVANKADVDDLEQEVLLKVWRNLASFRSEASLRTWIISVAINEARGFYRSRRRKPVFQTFDNLPLVAAEASAQDRFIGRETSEIVQYAVADLQPKYRDAIVVHDLKELSCKEAARNLDITVAALKIRVHRARRALAKKLGTCRFSHSRKAGN